MRCWVARIARWWLGTPAPWKPGPNEPYFLDRDGTVHPLPPDVLERLLVQLDPLCAAVPHCILPSRHGGDCAYGTGPIRAPEAPMVPRDTGAPDPVMDKTREFTAKVPMNTEAFNAPPGTMAHGAPGMPPYRVPGTRARPKRPRKKGRK